MLIVAALILLLAVAQVAVVGYTYSKGVRAGTAMATKRLDCCLREAEELLGEDYKCASLIVYIRASVFRRYS